MKDLTAHEMRRAYVRDVMGRAAQEAKDQAIKFLDVMDRNVTLEAQALALRNRIKELENETQSLRRAVGWQAPAVPKVEQEVRAPRWLGSRPVWRDDEYGAVQWRASGRALACWDHRLTKAIRHNLLGLYLALLDWSLPKETT